MKWITVTEVLQTSSAGPARTRSTTVNIEFIAAIGGETIGGCIVLPFGGAIWTQESYDELLELVKSCV